MNDEDVLKIIARAWGRKQEDEFYCFFPWIDREEQARAGIRKAGFHDGPAFRWPVDKPQILQHMAEHKDHDLYWCPSLFEYPDRKTENAVEEHALWADLDAVDPRDIKDYQPTIAWETSPGRYQALWVLNQGDILGASWAGGENQRMTYHLGADIAGWDTTQLLRIPGWKNHKLDYRVNGQAPQGKLLWKNGRTYLADSFDELPEVESVSANLTDVLVRQVEGIDVAHVKARIRLDLKRRIRELLGAKTATGDRSSVLWDIERSLADVGCTVEEIVAIVRTTVWNKYEGRADELKRLVIEATKAVSHKTEPSTRDDIQAEEVDATKLNRLSTLLAGIKPPDWLVNKVLTVGGVGFIAGEPKMFKSWFGLDLAISVASGAKFLNYFNVSQPGPVMYIQAEDSLHTIKSRYGKIIADKASDRLVSEGDEIIWLPTQTIASDLDINALIASEIVLSEDLWQTWFDDQLAAGMNGQQYKLVIIDTLMMIAGDIEENKAQAMTTKLFKPLKQLARKHGIALVLVHHMSKSKEERRAGQRMLGSVANHAWAEDSMYLSEMPSGAIALQTESKSWRTESYVVSGVSTKQGWQPLVSAKSHATEQRPPLDARIEGAHARVVDYLRTTSSGRAGIKTIAKNLGIRDTEVRRTCTQLTKSHALVQVSYSQWELNGRN